MPLNEHSGVQTGGRDRAGKPDAEAIHQALKRLCTKGVRPYWVKDYCSDLLMLKGVERRLPSREASRDEAVVALVEYLGELVERIGKDEDRIVLRVVLGLDEKYLYKTAICRREVAGKMFRDGSDPVRAGTIRQYHEPRALQRLLALILKEEETA